MSYAQASQDLNVHPSQLRDWVKKFSEDPQHPFPGHGQMKPEQLEIALLKREVAKLKAERAGRAPHPASGRSRTAQVSPASNRGCPRRVRWRRS